MAAKVHPGMEAHYFPCYLWPTLHAHTTMYSLPHQFGDIAKIGLQEVEKPQSADIVIALSFGYSVMLQVAHAQNFHFKLGLDEEIKKCFQDHHEAWQASADPILPALRARLKNEPQSE